MNHLNKFQIAKKKSPIYMAIYGLMKLNNSLWNQRMTRDIHSKPSNPYSANLEKAVKDAKTRVENQENLIRELFEEDELIKKLMDHYDVSDPIEDMTFLRFIQELELNRPFEED